MFRIASLVCLLLFAISCKSDKTRTEPETESPSPAPTASQPAPTPAPPPTQAQPAEAAPAAPEPTTPEEIDAARKNAMLAGKDADVIKYCEMAGIKGLGEGGKGDGQSQLGCALAACRLNQPDKAKAWARGLPKALKEQANKICLANNVVL
jgi:3-oxoacyl-ACP reductase-like protein